MTSRVVPTQSSAQAVLAEFRSPVTVLGVLAFVAWLGFWGWRDQVSGDSGAAVSGVVLGLVLGADLFHRAVRRRRGLTGTHPLWPLVAGVGMAGLLAASGMADSVRGAAVAAAYVAGIVAILAVGGFLERRSREDPVSS